MPLLPAGEVCWSACWPVLLRPSSSWMANGERCGSDEAEAPPEAASNPPSSPGAAMWMLRSGCCNKFIIRATLDLIYCKRRKHYYRIVVMADIDSTGCCVQLFETKSANRALLHFIYSVRLIFKTMMADAQTNPTGLACTRRLSVLAFCSLHNAYSVTDGPLRALLMLCSVSPSQ